MSTSLKSSIPTLPRPPPHPPIQVNLWEEKVRGCWTAPLLSNPSTRLPDWGILQEPRRCPAYETEASSLHLSHGLSVSGAVEENAALTSSCTGAAGEEWGAVKFVPVKGAAVARQEALPLAVQL